MKKLTKIFVTLQVIAAAGLCGIAAWVFIYSGGDDQLKSGSSKYEKLATIAAPFLSAIVAYKASPTKLVIEHILKTDDCNKDIAMKIMNKV